MGGTVERFGFAFTAHHEARRGHRARYDTDYASPGGCCPFAMNDHVAFDTVDQVPLFPGEVVVVLNIEDHVRSKFACNEVMNERVIGRGIATHQVHRGPVFLPGRFIERKPGKVLQFFRQFRMSFHRDTAVMLADLCTGAARSTVRKKCEIFTGFEPKLIGFDAKSTKFHEMIAGTARAELGPCFVTETMGDRRHGPVRVHDLMLTASLEIRSDSKTRLALNDAGETILLAGNRLCRPVEYSHFHAARDIDPDAIREDRILGRHT